VVDDTRQFRPDEDEEFLRSIRVDGLGNTPDLDGAADARSRKQGRSWAQIPHHQGIALAKRLRSSQAWAVLLALDYAIFKAKSNPTRLTNKLLTSFGITRERKRIALRRLEAEGVVSVKWDNKRAPMVTSHWHKKR
jgi:hypothetical protein